MRRPPPSSERGVALLTVLLLVAVMSAIAVAVLDDIRFAVRRTANARSIGQAQWYALGAEAFARGQLAKQFGERSDGIIVEPALDGAARTFPIEHGRIAVRLFDRGACFNLNSVVTGEADAAVADPSGVAQLAALLEALETPSAEAERAAWALADWIDADDSPAALGAEDETYVHRGGYRTAGTLLAEESELRAVSGFTPELYDRLRPFVCALPMTGPTLISVNALKPGDAPVLSALSQGRLGLDAARRAIGERPIGGWRDHQAFLADPALKGAEGAIPVRQLALATRFFALDAQVSFGGSEVAMTALIEASPSGLVRTVARRWTTAE